VPKARSVLQDGLFAVFSQRIITHNNS